MAENPIDVIREAELDAERILAAATEQSESIQEAAHQEALSARKADEAAANAAAAMLLAAARERGRLVQEQAEAQADRELIALSEQAASRSEMAVRVLIDTLV